MVNYIRNPQKKQMSVERIPKTSEWLQASKLNP